MYLPVDIQESLVLGVHIYSAARTVLYNFRLSGIYRSDQMPYMLMGVVVLAVGFIFSRIKLPEIVHTDNHYCHVNHNFILF